MAFSIFGLFRRKPRYVWRPGRFGPKFEWLDHTRIRILEGPLDGQELDITTEIFPDKANCFAALDGQRIGRTYIERDPPGVGIVLWDIAVQERWRRCGVASIMTYVVFRELLSAQDRAVFKIRMMRLMKPADRNIELQNVGIGVIGNRLGFNPEFDVQKLLSPKNVTGMSVLPAKNNFPPSFKIVIRTFPLVLIAFVLDPDSMRPVQDLKTYIHLMKDDSVIFDWVRRGLIVVGNGNYWLRSAGIGTFVNHIATDAVEAKVFHRRIRGA